MSFLVPITLFGWIPFVLVLFACFRPVRAVVVAYIGAWLFLPMAAYQVFPFHAYGKMFGASLGIILATAVFQQMRFVTLRPRWFDLPMVVWCVVPFASSISNELGAYDGLSEMVSQTTVWGLPYVIGRMYLADLKGLRELAIGILIGGLLYAPLCLWEIRMSPTLHFYLYGFHQHSWVQHIRFGGYRPKVFMQHGLAVGMWMAAASFVAVWLWRVGGQTGVWGIPMWLLTGLLMVTTLLCKSVNAIAVLALGTGALFLTKWLHRRTPLVVLLVLPWAYMCARASDLWSGRQLVELTAEYVSKERAESLEDRLLQEDLYSAKAYQRPLFGWGGWGRMRPIDEASGRELTCDGMWTIALGSNGLVGLISWATWMMLPSLFLVLRYTIDDWLSPPFAVPGILGVLLILHTVDYLANGMENPLLALTAGGLAGFASRGVAAAGDVRGSIGSHPGIENGLVRR